MPGLGLLTGRLLSVPDEGPFGGGDEIGRKIHVLWFTKVDQKTQTRTMTTEHTKDDS